jgi:hypothetical protein
MHSKQFTLRDKRLNQSNYRRCIAEAIDCVGIILQVTTISRLTLSKLLKLNTQQNFPQAISQLQRNGKSFSG